jgi:hypothetical protein
MIRTLIMGTVIACVNHYRSRTMYHHRTWAMYYHYWAGLYVHRTWAMYYHHRTRAYIGARSHMIVMGAVVRALIMIATTANSNTPRNIACP